MILNGKFVMILVLGAIATWRFPAGVFIDAAIVLGYIYIKRRKPAGLVPGNKKQAIPATAPGDATTSDLVKLVAMSMLGKQGGAIDPGLAAKFGFGASTPAPRGPASASERAFRRQLVD